MLLNCGVGEDSWDQTSPLDCKEIKPVNPKGNQSWIFIGRTDAEAPNFDHLMWRTDLLEKTLILGKIEGRRRRGWQRDEIVGWHHWLNGHEFEQTLGDSEACHSPWGHKESDTPEWLNKVTTFSWASLRTQGGVCSSSSAFVCGEVGWLHSPLTPFLPAASPALPTRSSSGSQRKEEAEEADEEQGAGDASVSGGVPARHTAWGIWSGHPDEKASPRDSMGREFSRDGPSLLHQGGQHP